ncbi:uncharacterized protein FOMMEDRAFT_111219 [Fomitiporia mediterranea MF3/22]|uniref:uncharacterized protein n=1 Tax=Fomitiporia mediterranea (strain MF3/22) TaxID=694068 RepID=UPI0004407626|nr:uncharacterized protein FOMMEDRAFT_111219 [Fomitiporia mediterranea MF3/22]EJD01420.1 hypothetical protein FOMMEDRAFT_111219 [Fomitiporia mediterranea MF3/22]
MPAGYAALPNRRLHPDEDELEAAFEASDDEDDRDVHNAESRPLNPDSHPFATTNTVQPVHTRMQSTSAPGTYNFEAVDYDCPPPGSPPSNAWGNSNGVIPTSPVLRPRAPGQGSSWVRRILPASVADRLVGGERRPRRLAGGGVDGVFANVTAKPTAPRQIQEGEDIYVVPEDAQKDAPPSYAAAQADAVPPYWETTVHAPSSLSPGMMVPGELPIEGLATGTVFSFLWNMLVSISFQFVGFLLTYLLHTTHAAKLGARAGLGLTLVQYGFAIKSNKEDLAAGGGEVTWSSNSGDTTISEPVPTFSSVTEADTWYANHPNGTMTMGDNNGMMGGGSFFTSDSTSEWLAFLLMTIGWFILLNSLLGFWRIKRWERSILASHEEHPDRPPQIPTNPNHNRQSSFARHFERTLGLRLPNLNMALGLNNPGRVAGDQQLLYEYDENFNRTGHDLERGSVDDEHEDRLTIEEEIANAIPADHPERERLIAEAIANERRLQQDLRAAGLL